jgi:hypothetical protein
MADDIYIGGKQIPNPKGIKPQLDSDPVKPPIQNKGAVTSVLPYYKGDSGMDTSNPVPPTERKNPIDELFGRGIKRTHGRSIPKADVQVSDN